MQLRFFISETIAKQCPEHYVSICFYWSLNSVLCFVCLSGSKLFSVRPPIACLDREETAEPSQGIPMQVYPCQYRRRPGIGQLPYIQPSRPIRCRDTEADDREPQLCHRCDVK